MWRNVILILAVGVAVVLSTACNTKMHCAEDCQKTRDLTLQTCDGDACQKATADYDACIKICDAKHDDGKR
jgi:hypothetical protein